VSNSSPPFGVTARLASVEPASLKYVVGYGGNDFCCTWRTGHHVDCPVWTYKSPCPSGRPPDSDLDHAARVAHAHDLQNDDIMCALALTYVADVDDIL